MSERTVRHRDDGPSTYLGPVRTAPGEERDVDPDTAAYLVDGTGYFEYVYRLTEACGAEMSDGSTCERPADECPYESHRE